MNYTIYLTDNCNMNCKYCYEKEMHKNNQIDIKMVKNIIDHEVKNKTKQCIITFFGGEPLLNFKVLQQIVEYAEQTYPNNWEWLISTNGFFLTDDICQFLKQYNFIITLSWDGIKPDQDKQRPIKNSLESSYDILLNKINILLKYQPYNKLNIRTTITKENISNFYLDYKLFEQYNFDSFIFDLEYFTDWTEPLLNILKDEIEKVYQDRAFIYRQNKTPTLNFALSTKVLKEYLQGQLELLLEIPDYVNTEPVVYTNCGYGLEVAIVDSNEFFYPCHEEPNFFKTKYSNKIGTLETGIDLNKLEVLQNNIKQIEQNFLDNRTCYKTCNLKKYHLKCAYISCPANLYQTKKVSTYNCIIKQYCLELLLKYGLQLYNQSDSFMDLLKTFPTYNIYQDIISQKDEQIKQLYIKRYKKDLIYKESD